MCLRRRALASAALAIPCIRQAHTFGKSMSAPRNKPSIHSPLSILSLLGYMGLKQKTHYKSFCVCPAHK